MVRDSRVKVRPQDWGKECNVRMGDEGNDHPCFTGEEMKDRGPPREVRRQPGTASRELVWCSPTRSLSDFFVLFSPRSVTMEEEVHHREA